MDPDQLRQILKEELKPVIETQKEHSRKLDEHSKNFDKQDEKLDSLTTELAYVHKKVDVAHDLVQALYENNKREIDEIKDYVGWPKQPYFGETD